MGSIVDVTGGEAELRWVRLAVAGTPPQALSIGQIQLSLTPIRTGEHAWHDPDQAEQVDESTIRAALLVDDRFPPGAYRLHVRVIDDPETILDPVLHGRVDVR